MARKVSGKRKRMLNLERQNKIAILKLAEQSYIHLTYVLHITRFFSRVWVCAEFVEGNLIQRKY